MGDRFHNCRMSADGTDARTAEPCAFSSMWFSYKLNVPGFRYKGDVRICSRYIVMIIGPLKAEDIIDVQAFRQSFLQELE